MGAVRFIVATLLLCGGVYPTVLWVTGRLVPEAADGSLTTRDGHLVGSRLIAQKFTLDLYLWPRPSAADFNGAAASGSNLSPSNPALTDRAKATLAALGGEGPVPADLVAASGGGLDPHVTLAGALYQAPRIARARGVALDQVETELRKAAEPEGLFRPALVNVLEANLALDAALGRP